MIHNVTWLIARKPNVVVYGSETFKTTSPGHDQLSLFPHHKFNLTKTQPLQKKMTQFYFGDSASVSSLDSEDNLPYPQALPRSDFLTPDFSAPEYLSTLSNRHQTLEDLRSDLRERSQLLSKELLDLVNENYESFLGLGEGLRGGKEKVEDVRVGLLGFRRGVEEVRKGVMERRVEVEELVGERRRVLGEIEVGRGLLEVDGRLEELEERLLVQSLGRGVNADGDDIWSDSEEEDEEGGEDEDGEDGESWSGIRKLERLVKDFKSVQRLAESIGAEHPFIVAQESRMLRVRNTLLLDLGTALKQAKAGPAGKSTSGRLVKILGIYREMGENEEAVKALRNTKS